MSNLPLELAQMDVRPGSEAVFAAELEGVLPLIAAADGCRSISVYTSHEKSNRFRLLVRWESVDHHLRFRQTASAAAVREIFARHVEIKAETEHLLHVATRTARS